MILLRTTCKIFAQLGFVKRVGLSCMTEIHWGKKVLELTKAFMYDLIKGSVVEQRIYISQPKHCAPTNT